MRFTLGLLRARSYSVYSSREDWHRFSKDDVLSFYMLRRIDKNVQNNKCVCCNKIMIYCNKNENEK